MIDLRCHVLSGLDDGADDEATALAMLQLAVANGTKGVVCTPHVVGGEWLPAWDRIVQDCRNLQEMASCQGLEVSTYPGVEVALDMDILDLIEGPGPYCIDGGKYLLVELPSMHIPSFAEDFFFLLQSRGITPILAHAGATPGRNADLPIARPIIGNC